MTSEERHEARYKRRSQRRMSQRMKAQHSFEEVFSFDHLYTSYEKCCNGVRWKPSTQAYACNAMKNVRAKQIELFEGRERTRGFVEFDICDRGKMRHIRSCHISDRVVQRCLCDYCLVPQISRTFVYDNGASLPGHGMDFALNRMDAHLHQYYRSHGADGYILQMDFKGFFDNISHATAKREIDRCVLDNRLRMRAYACLDVYGDKGVGMGAMSSQVLALCVPNALDHFIKEVLRIRWHGRYMDDSYCIHESREYLEECLHRILEKCAELEIPVNMRKTRISKLKRFRFLKISFSLTATGSVARRPNRKSFKRMRNRLKVFRRWVTAGRMEFQDVVASIASWMGSVMRSKAYHGVRRMIALFKNLFKEEIKQCSTLPKTVC